MFFLMQLCSVKIVGPMNDYVGESEYDMTDDLRDHLLMVMDKAW